MRIFSKQRFCYAGRTGRHGFTLIEILVVIGVVLLLAGLLFPVLSRARENGRRATCQNNLKQIASVLMLYMQDNNRRYPPPTPLDSEGDIGWSLTLADRAKNDTMFQCPTEERPADEGFTDYWINGGLLGIGESRVRSAANVILFGEGEGSAVDYNLGPTVLEPWKSDSPFTTRHLGGANYAFADGHVKWLLPNQITTTDAPNGQNFTFVVG